MYKFLNSWSWVITRYLILITSHPPGCNRQAPNPDSGSPEFLRNFPVKCKTVLKVSYSTSADPSHTVLLISLAKIYNSRYRLLDFSLSHKHLLLSSHVCSLNHFFIIFLLLTILAWWNLFLISLFSSNTIPTKLHYKKNITLAMMPAAQVPTSDLTAADENILRVTVLARFA